MPKRKRDAGDSDSEHDKVPLGAQEQRVRYKLEQGVRKLGHAFKIAKGFERQKLGRRQKSAAAAEEQEGETGRDAQRIESEIAALKTLDTTASAQQYLYKTLTKIKPVAESSALPGEVRLPLRSHGDAASLNVNARLCNSNPVKDALPAILKDLQRALGVEVVEEGGMKKRVRKKDFEAAQSSDGSRMKAGKSIAQPTEQPELEAHRQIEDQGDDSEDSEDEFAGFDDRLASDSEDGVGSDMSVGDLERQLELEGIQRKASAKPTKAVYDHAADLSISDNEDDNSDLSASDSPQPQKSSKSRAAPAPPTKSAYLPTLSMGGYISGDSGSEIEDIDIAPKKNRRGQRARQQIWEKKFGKGAKHLQNPSGADGNGRSDRNAGWDAKRGATGPNGDRKQRGASGLRGSGGRRMRGQESATGANDSALAARKEKKRSKDDEGPLHPSWQAKKLAKEKASAPVKFEGKRVTFD